jgi:hypothetical protein
MVTSHSKKKEHGKSEQNSRLDKVYRRWKCVTFGPDFHDALITGHITVCHSVIISCIEKQAQILISHNCACVIVLTYGVVSNILRTGATIYTAVVVARTTDPNRSNREFGVLLRRFATTA